MHILVVEDEPRVADFVMRGLVEEGHAVDVTGSAAAALEHVRGGSYDAVVLDIGLPDGSGYAVTQSLRADGVTTPILMLTARDASEDIVRGLDMGADDYLTKPFDFAELVARLRALDRRASGGSGTAGAPVAPGAATMQVVVGDVQLDRLRREVHRAGTHLRLTPIEFRLLEVLMVASGTVVTRVDLLDLVWGMSFDPGTGLIDVHVANLRQKLEQHGGPRVIVAVKGVGFAFTVSDA